MHHNSKQLHQLQADLDTARAEIHKLKQENTSLRKQLAPKSSTTEILPYPSGCTTSPTISSLPRNPPTHLSTPFSPNKTSLIRLKQFSSADEPTGFKLTHVPFRHRLPLQQLCSNLYRLHIDTYRILNIHYSGRSLVNFLIHIGYETERRSQLSKFNVTARDDFDPLDPSIIRDATPINEPIDYKVQLVPKAFLHRTCIVLLRFRIPIYNAIANFFVQSDHINLECLASYQSGYRWNPSRYVILDPTLQPIPYTLYDETIPSQSFSSYLGTHFCLSEHINLELLNANIRTVLFTLNRLSSIGLHSEGFASLPSAHFYSQIVRAQLEYGLAITKITSFLKDAQNMCLHRIFSGFPGSPIKVMLHMAKLRTMQEHSYIFQSQFLLSFVTLPEDALLSCLLQNIRSSGS
ncbi:hypothetical protein G6F37_001277 [Rhizopus arrhizus]|nr:hypothetical protein G6F38_007451 [Rhizopus arrhizus]KAG1163355.1 hypothetical protein G6F37_001277 [Rhizopus arrhizus]